MNKPERVLIIHPGPDFSVADVFTGYMEAFSALGCRTIDYNLGDRLAFYFSALIPTGKVDEDGRPQLRRAWEKREDAIGLAVNGIGSTFLQFWPQLVIVISSFFITPRMIAVMRDRGSTVVVVHTECPYEDDRQLQVAKYADLNLLNDKVTITKYQRLGVPTYYMPHAYRPKLHYPGPGDPEYASDFCFNGTAYPSRWEFFENLHAAGAFDGIDVSLSGNWAHKDRPDSPLLKYVIHDPSECFDNEQVAQVYRAGKVGLNMYRREAMEHNLDQGGWSMGPREVEMAACGLFFLRDPRGESDAIFPMLPTFSTPEDAAEQIQYWVHHDAEREEVAMAARAAIRGRTFDANAQALLGLLERV
jgi:spore maturation protein CgeB